MEKGSISYILDALKMIRVIYIYLFSIMIFGAISYFPLLTNSITLLKHSFWLKIVFLAILVIIDGKVSEIILNKKNESLFNVFKRYFIRICGLGLFFALIIMLIIFGIYVLNNATGNKLSGFHSLFYFRNLIINVLLIYTVPLIYFDVPIYTAISLGLKSLVGNMKFTSPLIVLSLIEGTMYSVPYIPINIGSKYLNFFAWEIGIIIDLIVFIAASMILKEKVFAIENGEIV